MVSDKQASRELMVRNWSFTYFEELDTIHAGLKEIGVSPHQILQLVEATNELRDPDFRAAAFELLQITKRTGKSCQQAEAYAKELDSQIAAKEKQGLDWGGRIENELRDWEQKRNDERAKFESEQAQNKRLLEEDRQKRKAEREKFESEQARNKRRLEEDNEKLNRELGKNNELRENIEETITLKAELKRIGLDLPTFKSMVREAVKARISPDIGKKIQEDVKKLGSLYKVIAKREKEEQDRRGVLKELADQAAMMRRTIREQGEAVDWNKKIIEENKWQYEFFELFISMLLNSPSAGDSLTALGLRIQALGEKGWRHSTVGTPEKRRAAFIMTIMGLYLHSIHCGNCGARFIVDQPCNAYSRNRGSYYCPVCFFSWYTKPDDAFFNLMVSPGLVKRLQATKALLDRMEKMDPEIFDKKLRLFDSLPNKVINALSEGRSIKAQDYGTDSGREV